MRRRVGPFKAQFDPIMVSTKPGGVRSGLGPTSPATVVTHSHQTMSVTVIFLLLMMASSTNALESPRYETVYACEGSTLTMDCEPGHVISLIRANYGRFSLTICNDHGNTEWSVNCMSPRSHRVLHDRCTKKQNCSVAASTRGFGDPCPGTLKYLEAHFLCIPVTPASATPRPIPPWFLPTPTLHPPHSRESTSPHKKVSTEETTTSSTTTLRPPPWLVTNSSRNMTAETTSTSTTTTTTTTTTSATTASVVVTEVPLAEDEDSVVVHDLPDEESERQMKEVVDKIITDKERTKDRKTNDHLHPSSTRSPDLMAEVPAQDSGTPFSAEMWCPPSETRGLYWNWTREGEVSVQPCPGGASGWARRSCQLSGWTESADLSECRSAWLAALMTRASSNDAVLAVANDLATVTGSRALYGGDVTATSRVLNSLSRRMADDVSNFPEAGQREALVTELVYATLSTGSNLLGEQYKAWGDLSPSEFSGAATALLLGLEETVFLLADNLHQEKIVSHSESNIVMRLQVIETRNVRPLSFPSSGETWKPPSEGDEEGAPPPPGDSVTLPVAALLENADNGLVKVVFFSFDGLQRLLPPARRYRPKEATFKGVNETQILNSRVISASLGAGRHIELPEPVVVTFEMLRTDNVTNPSCVFWDYTTSTWSEEGCTVVMYNRTHTVCECDHLTNFAVLMDVHATPLSYGDEMALSVITYIGCVISIVCLLLATVVFHAFKSLKNDRTVIHKNLCLCLLLAEAIFVAGVNQTHRPIVCGVVAGLLHFFFLAAFAWMFMEGFQLYVMLVEVFESEKSRVRWYYATSYGVPAVVVAVSAIVNPLGYGSDSACWLRTENYFIFAFVGPVIFVIVANSIFLVMSLIVMCRHSNTKASLKNKEQSKLDSIRIWIRGAVILMFLLGITWTFGLLYLNEATVTMAYVFTVFNSLQGLFIFIFHCVQNEKLVPRCSRKDASSKSSNGTMVQGMTSPQSEDVPPAMNGGRGSLVRASHRSTGSRSSRHMQTLHTRSTSQDHEDEKYSFKSCGRDSGHGGSEQEDSPRTAATTKMASIRLNNNISPSQPIINQVQTIQTNPFGIPNTLEPNRLTADPLLPDYRLVSDEANFSLPITAGNAIRNPSHRNPSPWNHTYTEIPEGAAITSRPDPVYEEIEREARSEIQVSDLSDEDGRRQHSDISRQSSKSYSDHRPLLPYTLTDQRGPVFHAAQYDPRLKGKLLPKDVLQLSLPAAQMIAESRFPQHFFERTMVSPGHIIPVTHPVVTTSHAPPPGNGHITTNGHRYPEALLKSTVQLPVVQPLSEPNLKSWEAVQRHRDLEQLQQQLGEMTVAVLNGEQVVCKLKSPLAPIHEHTMASGALSSNVSTVPTPPAIDRFGGVPSYSHC